MQKQFKWLLLTVLVLSEKHLKFTIFYLPTIQNKVELYIESDDSMNEDIQTDIPSTPHYH